MMSLILILLIGAAVFFAESSREQKSFVITDYEVRSEKLKGLGGERKIVFLSDLHNKVYGNRNEILLEAIRKQEPDMIFIGGDMLVGKTGVPYEAAMELVRGLPRIAPVYYALGNHEQRMKLHPEIYGNVYREYKSRLLEAGVHFLENTSAEAELGECRIRITGAEIPEEHYQKFVRASDITEALDEALERPVPERYEILLAHNPAMEASYRKWGADLILSGHLHGGIIRLPFLGGLITPQACIFPSHSGEMSEKDGKTLVVSKGLGTHTVNIRFLNPAELVVLHLKSE